MSYIANVQGKRPSNPINELNTQYTSRSDNVNEEYPHITPSGQNMYNNEPISQYETEYNNTYVSTLENLRTKTESMNMALEAALVPNIIPGECILQKGSYLYNDTICPINEAGNECVLKVNMVKFKSDKCRRLCYNKTIHIYSGTHISSVTNEVVNDNILHIMNEVVNKYSPISYDDFIALNPQLAEFSSDEPLDVGIDIDTGIPSNILNLVNMGYIFPFLGFVNDRAVAWLNMVITVDNIDTYIIINNSKWVAEDAITNGSIKFDYLDIPFKVDYYPSFKACDPKYNGKMPIFWFNKFNGYIDSDENFSPGMGHSCEAIYTDDPYIIYEEFVMDEDSFSRTSTTRFGTLYNKKFTDFDYRFKIKRFNILGFESIHEYYNKDAELRDDFEVETHQFNILKISLDRILTNKRRFKIFYNTRVMYDQDNMLRIKNIQYLEEQFTSYMRDVSSNVKVFIDEVYNLMSKDYGCYIDDQGNEYWYIPEQKGFNTKDGDPEDAIPIDYSVLTVMNYVQPDSQYMSDNGLSITKKYVNQEYDVLKLRTEIVHFNNMEEGSTPSDEFIYYGNTDCNILLKELAIQIFDVQEEGVILSVMYNLINRAHIDEYVLDIQSNDIPKNEWFIRKNLPEMFLYDLKDDYALDDMSLLDEVFDFTYNDRVTYKENLIHGLQYVIGYDADKLESSILKSIVSKTYLGSDLLPFINNSILTMSRGMSTYPNNNYVMIFKNGELYANHDTITYDQMNFNIRMVINTDLLNTDVFEIVYFLNVNNNILPVEYDTITVPNKIKNGDDEDGTSVEIDAIPCNTTLFNPENLMVLVDKIPNDTYNDEIDFSAGLTAYNLNYRIKSYKDLLKEDDDDKFVTSTLSDDEMINGLHRVTKQGGGEYFILPSIEPIEQPQDPGNVPSNLVGINEYVFSGCNSINTMSFNGTKEQWANISKSEDWKTGMKTQNINNSGGITCTDGKVKL